MYFFSQRLVSSGAENFQLCFNRSFAICLFATLGIPGASNQSCFSFNRSFAICLFATPPTGSADDSPREFQSLIRYMPFRNVTAVSISLCVMLGFQSPLRV